MAYSVAAALSLLLLLRAAGVRLPPWYHHGIWYLTKNWLAQKHEHRVRSCRVVASFWFCCGRQTMRGLQTWFSHWSAWASTSSWQKAFCVLALHTQCLQQEICFFVPIRFPWLASHSKEIVWHAVLLYIWQCEKSYDGQCPHACSWWKSRT